MVRQINPGLARLYTKSDRSYGYQNGVELAGLSSGQERALDFLETGISDSQLDLLPKMSKATPQEVRDLIQRLGPMLRTTSSFYPEFSERDVQSRFSEILRLFTASEQDPAQVLKQRRASRIFLTSIDSFGLILARACAAAALGTIITDDQTRIAQSDLGALGFSQADLGVPRAVAAKQMLDREIEIQMHSRVSASFDRIQVAIITGTDVINPKLYQRWLSRDIPHLAVTFDESGVVISHLVIPGVTPCLGCVELERAKQDPSWLAKAIQLDFLDRDLADANSKLFAASVALARTLRKIDHPLEQLDTRGIRLRSSDQAVFECELTTRNCGCR